MQDGSEYNWWNTGRGIMEELDRECLRFDEMSSAPIMTRICMSIDLKEMFEATINECGVTNENFKTPGLFIFGVEVFFMPEWPEHTIRIY